MLQSLIDSERILAIALVLLSFLGAFASLKLLRGILPRDHGKDFAIDGQQSAGKYTGAGVIFITVFVLVCVLIIPMNIERIIYLAGIYLSMISGFLDDSAKVPWGRVKKGLLDLVIAVSMSGAYCYFNKEAVSQTSILGMSFNIPVWLYVILGAALVWGSINVTNCSDGVDGLCGSLSIISLITVALAIWLGSWADNGFIAMIAVMVLCILAYLWYNANPSGMLMGDAGSRAIGVMLAVAMMKTGSPLLFFPICLLLIIDGGASLVKISCIKFLGLKGFMKNIRTPIHDHLKKNSGWSPTQIVFRLAILQTIISLSTVAALYF